MNIYSLLRTRFTYKYLALKGLNIITLNNTFITWGTSSVVHWVTHSITITMGQMGYNFFNV